MIIMFEWLANNYMTVIIIAVVALVLGLDVIYLIRQRKKGGMCSGCQGCSGCSNCKNCGSHKADNN